MLATKHVLRPLDRSILSEIYKNHCDINLFSYWRQRRSIKHFPKFEKHVSFYAYKKLNIFTDLILTHSC